MNRQQAKDMLPIIQALAEGKHIQLKDIIGNWIDVDFINVEICNPNNYRIKPFKYYPFKNVEECWAEMQKHQPFGWVKDKEKENYALITVIRNDSKIGEISVGGNTYMDLSELMNNYTFADGTPFGIKEK